MTPDTKQLVEKTIEENQNFSLCGISTSMCAGASAQIFATVATSI